MSEPVVHVPNPKTGNWDVYDETINRWEDTGRPYNQAGTQVKKTTFTNNGGGRKSRRITRNRGHSKKHKRVHHTRRKQSHRHRHSRRRHH